MHSEHEGSSNPFLLTTSLILKLQENCMCEKDLSVISLSVML